MPASKKGIIARSWPFDHKASGLNGDTNLIKIIAMISMVVDHLGAALFPRTPILRIIGRLAFPIYAYCIAAGCAYTRNMGKYLHRIVLLALISQPVYVIALNHTNTQMFAYRFFEEPVRAAVNFYVYSWKHPSILLTLAIGIVVIWSLKERKIWITALIMLLTFLLQRYVDYGIRGVFLILLLYMFIDRWYVSLPLVAAFMIYWGLDGNRYNLFGISFSNQLCAVLALPLIYIPMRTGIKLNKLVFYAFYPAHLVLIIILKNINKIMALINGV